VKPARRLSAQGEPGEPGDLWQQRALRLLFPMTARSVDLAAYPPRQTIWFRCCKGLQYCNGLQYRRRCPLR